MKLDKRVLFLVLVLAIVFSLGTQFMPRHVDSWIEINMASHFLENGINFTEPFTGESSTYPPGSFVIISVLSSVTELDFLLLGYILRILNFIILSVLVYTLAKVLFKDSIVAVVCGLFTPLILTNVTMLGPAYLTPLVFATMLLLLFFVFLVKEEFLLASLVFVSLALTHISTTVFAIISLFLYFIFNRKYWKRLWFALLMMFFGILVFGYVHSYGWLIENFLELIVYHKSKPFFSFDEMLTYTFVPLFGLGLYFITQKAEEARKFLIPIIVFLVLDLFLLWNWQGFFIRYRRVIYYIFMLMPFFVGFGVYNLAHYVNFKKFNFKLVLVLLLIILVPLAIKANVELRGSDSIHVNENEHEFFQEFGKLYPNQSVATNHLQSYALPYYNIKPVQLSPGHGVNNLYFKELAPCFKYKSVECFEKFFTDHPDIKYLYYGGEVNSTFFEPFFERNGLVIYRYKNLNME